MPSSAATAWVTNPSRTGTRSTKTPPNGYWVATASAVLTASRVFPTPPGPTRLTTLPPPSASRIAACSRSRPMNAVRVVGSPVTGPSPAPAGGWAATAGASPASALRSGTPNFRSSDDT